MSVNKIAQSVPVGCPACKSDLYRPAAKGEWTDAQGQSHDMPDGSRVIGLYDWETDRTETWKCPDCGHEWPRD